MEGANPHGIRVYTDTELPQVSLSVYRYCIIHTNVL